MGRIDALQELSLVASRTFHDAGVESRSSDGSLSFGWLRHKNHFSGQVKSATIDQIGSLGLARSSAGRTDGAVSTPGMEGQREERRRKRHCGARARLEALPDHRSRANDNPKPQEFEGNRIVRHEPRWTTRGRSFPRTCSTTS